MRDSAFTVKHNDSISVCFSIENETVFPIGEKMNEMDGNAYMNGYNWEAFLSHYLAKNHPEILENMNTDPEAGMYAAYYELTPENEARAEKFAGVLNDLVANEEAIYDFLKAEGDNIEWD